MASVRNVTQKQFDSLRQSILPRKRVSATQLTDLGYASLWNAADKEFWIILIGPVGLVCSGCNQALPDDPMPPWWVKAPKGCPWRV